MNSSAPLRSSPSAMSRHYQERIAGNIQKLLAATGLSQNAFAEKLRKNGLEINQGTISKYIKGDVEIQLSVVVKICEVFKIPISELVSDNFIYIDRDNAPTALDETPERKDSVLYIPIMGDKFTTDPKDRDFNGYLQTYYCYFFPTLSNEDRILKGTLTLRAGASVCEASLLLDTNRKRNGEPIYKTYSGCAIISTSVHAMYIILSSPDEGEICVLNLRHFFIRHQSLNCRMAEVLTNAAGETHAPTVHRMLMSRERVSDEDLQVLAPHLHLNSSEILISKEALMSIEGDKSEKHKNMLEHLVYLVDEEPVYRFREDYVRSNALQFLNKDETLVFLSQVRERSNKMRYNKVSNKVDETVHSLLRSMGYFANEDA